MGPYKKDWLATEFALGEQLFSIDVPLSACYGPPQFQKPLKVYPVGQARGVL